MKYIRCMFCIVAVCMRQSAKVWEPEGNLYSCDRPNHLSLKDFKIKRENDFICNKFVLISGQEFSEQMSDDQRLYGILAIVFLYRSEFPPFPPRWTEFWHPMRLLMFSSLRQLCPIPRDECTNWHCQYPSMYQQHTHSPALVFSCRLDLTEIYMFWRKQYQ